MRIYLYLAAIILAPCLAFADPQCVLPPSVTRSATATISDPITTTVAQPLRSSVETAEHGPDTHAVSASGTGIALLDHVVAAGAHVTDIGVSHGLRTVIARSDGQFVRLYVSADGQAAVAGLMADLSPADLLTMASGQVTELSPNAVHFAIRMAALKSMRVVGCGVRGRRG